MLRQGCAARILRVADPRLAERLRERHGIDQLLLRIGCLGVPQIGLETHICSGPLLGGLLERIRDQPGALQVTAAGSPDETLPGALGLLLGERLL